MHVRTGRVGVVTICEDIDMVNAEEFRAAMTQALRVEGVALLVVDLHAAGVFGSDALNALVWAHREVVERGLKMLVVSPSPLTNRVLRVLGLDGLPALTVIEQPPLVPMPASFPKSGSEAAGAALSTGRPHLLTVTSHWVVCEIS